MKHYPIDTYDSARAKALKKIKNASDDSEILEEITTEEDPKKKEEREANCMAVRMIMDKCLENYRDGEYEFHQTVKMICEALKAL